MRRMTISFIVSKLLLRGEAKGFTHWMKMSMIVEMAYWIASWPHKKLVMKIKLMTSRIRRKKYISGKKRIDHWRNLKFVFTLSISELYRF